MNGKLPLSVSPAPHIKGSLTLPRMMWFTFAALLFPAAAGVFFFGPRVILLLVTCVAAALLTESVILKLRKGSAGPGTGIKDGSAAVTGMIMALILPPSFPLWAAALGAVFAIAAAKHIFGGLGSNIFNPALIGRAFLVAAFPLMITSYSAEFRNLTGYEAVSSATPLARVRFEGETLSVRDNFIPFLIGEKRGSAGETSPLLILIGLLILLGTKTADWRLPVSYFAAVLAFSALIWAFDPGGYINPILALFTGGVFIGGSFMVTDPVTTPVTPRGKVIFGAGAGLITVLIRSYSGYAEGVMFAILLMNALTPLINRRTAPRIYGT